MITTIHCQQPRLDPGVLAMIVGDNGIAIMDAIAMGASDAWTIHAMTGLPVPCVEGRLPVLAHAGLIEETTCGRLVLATGGREILLAMQHS